MRELHTEEGEEGMTQAQLLLTPGRHVGADVIKTVMESLVPWSKQEGYVLVNSEEYIT